MRSVLALVAVILSACSPAAPAPAATVSATSAASARAEVTATPSSATAAATAQPTAAPASVTMKEFPVPAGSGPHDVAPAIDGGVWFTAQRSGQLGWLDPKTGQTKMIALGAGSAPHGVIVAPDGTPWVTDGGLNAIVRVDPKTNEVGVYRMAPTVPNINMNTAALQPNGIMWFTGQSGYVGRLDLRPGSPTEGKPEVVPAPRGPGPYGIAAERCGSVYYASLAGNYVGRIFLTGVNTPSPPSFGAEPIEPLTKDQGARRVWCDSKANVWVSEWNAGQVGRYDPRTGQWKEWKLPNSARPQAYAVYVDDRDIVWLSEWSSSSIVRFDPATETFTSYPYAPNGGVRQLHGRPGEVWGALSALDKLIVLTTR